MRLSGILIVTATIAAALVASEPAPALAGGVPHGAIYPWYPYPKLPRGGIYPWYRYGYNFPPPYGATPPAYLVTGRTYYCMYGYDYPYGCPFISVYDYPYGYPFVQ